MAGEKIPDHITAEDQETLTTRLSPLDKARLQRRGTTTYQPDYAKIAFELLSDQKNMKTKSHCCSLLQCSRTTLNRWAAKYPDFGQAITDGLEVGKKGWMEKIQKHAFKPSKKVNNGLIKLLSNVVYGIKEDVEPSVIVNTNINTDPETIMKKRGIPIPDVGIGDIDE